MMLSNYPTPPPNVSRVVITGDGKTVIATGQSLDKPGTLTTWDLAQAKKVEPLKGHQSDVLDFAVTPDGKTLVSTSVGSLKLWNLATRSETKTIQSTDGTITHISMAPKGDLFATVVPPSPFTPLFPDAPEKGAQIILRDIATGEIKARMDTPHHSVSSITFSPDGQILATVGSENLKDAKAQLQSTICFWDVKTLKETGRFVPKDQPLIYAVAFSADGRFLATSGKSSAVNVKDNPFLLWQDVATIWDVKKRSEYKAFRWKVGSAKALAFLPGSTLLAIGGEEAGVGKIKLWNFAEDKVTTELSGHKAEVNCLAWSSDGRVLASGSWTFQGQGSQVKVWRFTTAGPKIPATKETKDQPQPNEKAKELDQPEKAPKKTDDEILFKGKPASIWIRQLQDRDVSFRVEAVNALATIGGEVKGVLPAVGAVLNDKEESVRTAARKALAMAGTEGKLLMLAHDLQHGDQAARIASAKELGELTSDAKSHIPLLAKSLTDEDASVRAEAAFALGRIGDAASVPVNALEPLLADKDRTVRIKAALALSSLDRLPEKGIANVIEALQCDEPHMRLSGCKALGSLGSRGKEAVPQLCDLLTDKVEMVRTSAQEALIKVGVPPDVVPLLRTIRENKTTERTEAVKALRGHGQNAEAALPALLLGLQEEEHAYRNGIIQTFCKIGKPSVPVLIRGLDHEDRLVQLGVINALGSIEAESEDIVPALVMILGKTDSTLRCAATEALGKRGKASKMAVPALVTALEDPTNKLLPNYAATALGSIGPDAVAAVPALIKALSRENTLLPLGRDAAIALGKIGPNAKEAVPHLEKLTTHKDESVRRAAIEAVRQLQGR